MMALTANRNISILWLVSVAGQTDRRQVFSRGGTYIILYHRMQGYENNMKMNQQLHRHDNEVDLL